MRSRSPAVAKPRTAIGRGAVAIVLLVPLLVGGCSDGRLTYPSPDGERELRVEVGSNLDTYWHLAIKEKGLFGDSTEVGCFSDDDPATGTPEEVSWANNNEVVIAWSATEADDTVVEGETRLRLDPDGKVLEIVQPREALMSSC